MKYVVFSKALHSTWLLSCEYGILFDAGEGVGTSLGHKVFLPERLFFSHSHMDHIAGLPSLLGLRNAGYGSRDKPLAIYYPAGNRFVEDWLKFSIKQVGRLRYPLNIHPLEPFERVPLEVKAGSQEQRYVEGFPVRHGNNRNLPFSWFSPRTWLPRAYSPCYGYRIVSVTRKLKPEFRGKGQDFYKQLTTEAKEAMSEDSPTTKFFFSGDSLPLEQGPNCPLNGAELAFLDATFLNPEDRTAPTHATMEEVARSCAAAKVRVAYAMHQSIRYTPEEIIAKAQELQSIYPLRIIHYSEVTYLN